MSDWQQMKGTLFRRLSFAFLLLLVAKFSFEIPVDMGWIKDARVLPLVNGVSFTINMLLIVILFAILNIGYGARSGWKAKILISGFMGLFMLGVIAKSLGFSDWVESQGRIVGTSVYLLEVLLFMSVLLGLAVMSVKEMQERTTSDIRAKLGKQEENGLDASFKETHTSLQGSSTQGTHQPKDDQ